MLLLLLLLLLLSTVLWASEFVVFYRLFSLNHVQFIVPQFHSCACIYAYREHCYLTGISFASGFYMFLLLLGFLSI